MFTPATKLVVITEHFLSDKVCEIIEACGGKGYTIVPAGGKGLHHTHPTSEQATVVEGFDNVKIEVITRKSAHAEMIAQRILHEYFEDFPGIVYLEIVQISRPERF